MEQIEILIFKLRNPQSGQSDVDSSTTDLIKFGSKAVKPLLSAWLDNRDNPDKDSQGDSDNRLLNVLKQLKDTNPDADNLIAKIFGDLQSLLLDERFRIRRLSKKRK